MSPTQRLLAKGAVVMTLGGIWLGTKPAEATAATLDSCGCVDECPTDVTLYCFENCGSDQPGTCGVSQSCPFFEVDCPIIH